MMGKPPTRTPAAPHRWNCQLQAKLAVVAGADDGPTLRSAAKPDHWCGIDADDGRDSSADAGDGDDEPLRHCDNALDLYT